MARALAVAVLASSPNVGFVWAGYLLTAGALGGYLWRLAVRARRARDRATAIASKRSPRVR